MQFPQVLNRGGSRDGQVKEAAFKVSTSLLPQHSITPAYGGNNDASRTLISTARCSAIIADHLRGAASSC